MNLNHLIRHALVPVVSAAFVLACGGQDQEGDFEGESPEDSSSIPPGKADFGDETALEKEKFTGELAWIEPFCEDDDLFGPVFTKCHSGVAMMRIASGQKTPAAKKRFYYPASEEFSLFDYRVDPGRHMRVVYCMHDTGCEFPQEYIEVIVPEHWALVYYEPADEWRIILRNDFHTQQYDPDDNVVVEGMMSTEPYRGGDGQGFFWVLFNTDSGG